MIRLAGWLILAVGVGALACSPKLRQRILARSATMVRVVRA